MRMLLVVLLALSVVVVLETTGSEGSVRPGSRRSIPLRVASLRLAGLLPGYDTIGNARRRYGRGGDILGGHPNGAEIWRSRQTGWVLYVDGFEYRGYVSKQNAVIDRVQIAKATLVPLGGKLPSISLTAAQSSLFGKIRLGMTEAKVRAILKARGIAARKRGDILTWSEPGFVQVNRNTAYDTWSVRLKFDNSRMLDEIEVSAG